MNKNTLFTFLTIMFIASTTQIYSQVQLIQTFIEQNISGNTLFGVTVSTAGDVNNDGFDDVIVGANQYNSHTGRAYIFLGAQGTSMDDNADVTLEGEGTSNNFGRSVSNAGDVNNDGFDDVIVGANSYNSTGRVYIFFGAQGNSMDNIADVTLDGEASSIFGFSVSSAGDVNGDGYDDVIIGAFGYSSNTGRSYIYFGAQGTSMDNIADVTFTGGGTGNEFGYSASSAGDVNNDGFDDVIIGAYRYNTSTGRSHIFFGAQGTSMDNTADVTLTGQAINNYFGITVSSAGDVNNDGFDDVIVGANGHNSNTGRAYIYFGAQGTSMDGSPDVTFNGESINNGFGWSVSSAGDVNGDGFDDVIVGATVYNSQTGRSYIFFGSQGITMDNVADVTLSGESTNSQFGYSLSSAGDINGDGFDDVIIGANIYNSQNGRSYIYFGAQGTSMDNITDLILYGEGVDNQFGWSVSSAGDVNNDGFSDVIVGALSYNSNTGRAYIYYGAQGTSMDNIADVILDGESIDNYFGYSVSSAGDVNNDGFDDVIVGAYRFNSNTGRTYVFFGAHGTSMDNTADVTLNGEGTNNQFGVSVSSAGDVNNDGFDDVIVGAFNYNSYTGRAYIYFGAQGTSMDNSSDVILDGEGTGNNFGLSVSSAGDVNNDGFDDVIIGANGYNSQIGRAYIYFGAQGSSMDNNADVFLNGEHIENHFGRSVSNAGDVNNDGFDDVIVGAFGYIAQTGRAYIYFGAQGTLMDNNADVTLTGEAHGYYFGFSVSSAGDVNNDDFDDVIIGVWNYNSSTGRAYIYFGDQGSSMDNNADVIFDGEGTINEFGRSVSSAGDVNNDGFDDIIIGAWKYPDNGKAYIYTYITSTTFSLKAFIEGPYFSPNMNTAIDLNGQENHPYPSSIHDGTESVANDFFDSNPDIVDWVVVELRTGTDAASKVKTRAAFLKADGSIVDLDGTSDVSFEGLDESIDYYIVIHHRNHLPVMSASAVPIN